MAIHLHFCTSVIPILTFKYECMDAVFELMMSNSRLCEQVHGMMRKNLRIGTGQHEADNQRPYTTGIDCEMKDERRATANKRKIDHYLEKTRTKRDRLHADSKEQAQLLSHQFVTRSRAFLLNAAPIIDAKMVSMKNAINSAGRRVKDKRQVEQKYKILKSKYPNHEGRS